MSSIRNIADNLQNSGKLPLVEVHILRSTGGEMYNRGFNGRHKTLTGGGTVRNRFSSQSEKHAIRYQWEDRLNTRTRLLPEIVRQEVKNQLLRQHVGIGSARYLDQARNDAGSAGNDAHARMLVLGAENGNSVDFLVSEEGERLTPRNDCR